MSKKYYGAFDAENYQDNDLSIVGNFFNGLWNDITGKSAQTREFEQQEALLEKEQDFADERNVMKRQLEAGINANTAAAGIAGNSANPTAPQVSNNTSGVAGAVDALNNAVGSGAFGNIAQGVATLGKLPSEIGNILSDTEQKLTQSGLNTEMARSYAIGNLYLPEEKRLGILQLDQSIKNLGKEFDVYSKQIDFYDAQIHQIDQQIEESKASISLMEMQSLVQQRQSMLLEQQTFEMTWRNNIRQTIGIDPTLSVENNLFTLRFKNPEAYEKCVQVLGGINYRRFLGQYTAEDETAFDRALHENRGRMQGQVEYLPQIQAIQDINDVFMDYRDRMFVSPERMTELSKELIEKMKEIIDKW